MLHLQSKEKDRGSEKHRQAADGQGQAAALKQGQLFICPAELCDFSSRVC